MRHDQSLDAQRSVAHPREPVVRVVSAFPAVNQPDAVVEAFAGPQRLRVEQHELPHDTGVSGHDRLDVVGHEGINPDIVDAPAETTIGADFVELAVTRVRRGRMVRVLVYLETGAPELVADQRLGSVHPRLSEQAGAEPQDSVEPRSHTLGRQLRLHG
jgi:hypothetical protein